MFLAFAYSQNIQFKDVASELNAVLNHIGAAPMPMGSVVAIADIDNDGWLDIFVSNQGGDSALFYNEGDHFTDIAEAAGVNARGSIGSGAVFADYDNDGWKDLYLLNLGANILYHNNGDKTFTDVTQVAGVGDTGSGMSAAWGDYDNDGWLDLYVVNHMGPDGSADKLYHNLGNGRFEDVSQVMPELKRSGAGFVASWLDYDNDGDQDLYVVNDDFFGEHKGNVLWLNDGPSENGWKFYDVSTRSKTNTVLNGMGLAVGDYDNDLDEDLLFTNIGPNVLLEKQPLGQFRDQTQTAGVARQWLGGNREPLTWCGVFLDVDFDGFQDAFLCGSPLDKPQGQLNALFHNNGDKSFTDITIAAGMTEELWTRSAAYGDLDNDGDLDIYASNYGQASNLYQNKSEIGNWLTVRLQGVRSNRDGIGAKVYIDTQQGRQFQQIRSGSSLGAGNDIAAYFGLGDDESTSRLEIYWPSGVVQILNDIQSNQVLTVVEEASLDSSDIALEWVEPWHSTKIPVGNFQPTVRVRNLGKDSTRVTLNLSIHESLTNWMVQSETLELVSGQVKDVSFQGFQVEAGQTYELRFNINSPQDVYVFNDVLQTEVQGALFIDEAFAMRLSDEEPGSSVATGDVNADGLTDIYLVNSAVPNRLLLNTGEGKFEDVTELAGVGDTGFGTKALIEDLDGDSLADIYVVNARESNIFYHNLGNGTFRDDTSQANLVHKGAGRDVANGDFDKDGDTDLFLANDKGANVIYINDGAGGFTAIYDDPVAEDEGRTRAVIAEDCDQDNDLDLYLVRDNQPNKLYLNDGKAHFQETSETTGLDDKGRGQDATFADFDGDGDLDVYVSNLGQANVLYLNDNETFTDATTERGLADVPLASTAVIAGDFNVDGFPDLLIASSQAGETRVYLNDKGHFIDATRLFGIESVGQTTDAATADFDGDGLTDIYLVNSGVPDEVYIQTPAILGE